MHRLEIEDPPPCSHCGGCVWAGPPCCDKAAEEHQAYLRSPEYLALLKKQTDEGRRIKQANKLVKRQRRQAQLLSRSTWDTQDQFHADESAWEGFINRRNDAE